MPTQIIQALERIATLMKVHMWQISKELALSPLQIQIILILQKNNTKANNIAEDLGLKKPTISHTIKLLINKKLILKTLDQNDARSDILSLTKKGAQLARQAEKLQSEFIKKLESIPALDLKSIYANLYHFIDSMQKNDLIPLQASCFYCESYSLKNNKHYCGFLKRSLEEHQLRIECSDFHRAIN